MKPTARVTLLGGYPPPSGGNATHVARLSARLAAEGCRVAVIDPYSGRFETAPFENDSPRLAVAPTISKWKRVRQLGRLRGNSYDAILHCHISAGERFYRVAPIVLALTRSA